MHFLLNGVLHTESWKLQKLNGIIQKMESWGRVERARKHVGKFRGADGGIVLGRRLEGGLPAAFEFKGERK